MSTVSEEVDTTNETPEVPVRVPKKRGRKRKSEIALAQAQKVIETSPPAEETLSRRGRRRKKVNYFELANPDNVDLPTQIEDPSYEFESFEPKSKIKKLEKVQSGDELQRSDSSLGKQDVPVNDTEGQHEEDSASDLANGKQEYSSSSNSEEAINNTMGNDTNIIVEGVNTEAEATTSTPKDKDKKYSYTGETVKMMNTLFTLFSDQPPAQKSTSQKNTSNNNSVTAKSSNSGKRGYRKSKNISIKEEEIDDGTGSVTCAICNTILDKSLWSHHKQRYHNNLAWRVGDPPLDLNDQSFVMHTLNMLYKKKKPLYCDKCGEVKKSVVGFLSHRSQCLKSEEQLDSVKIKCELCGRKMLPVSMTIHMKTIHQNPTEKMKDFPDHPTEANRLLPSKRSAARKAMRIIETVTKNDDKEKYFSTNLDLRSQEFVRPLIQQEIDETRFFECKFNCNCITRNIEDAIKHMEECTEKLSEGFVCKKCLNITSKLEEILNHIESTHEIAVEKDCDYEFIEKEAGRGPGFLRTNFRRTDKCLFPHAFEWTVKFCEQNFSKLLFQDLPFNNSNWQVLPPDQATEYLPKMNESCHIARTDITSFINPLKCEYAFQKYNLFESEVHNNKITLFCGGPISSMAWLPTPYTRKVNQILAVSVLKSPDEKYTTYENFDVKCAIQFWDFGPLANTEFSLEEPKLIFSLAHNHGPVWHMEWCPSGCYNDDRMGLLAVTGADTVVYIYALPLPTEEEGKETERGLMYKSKPVMKLLLQQPTSRLLGGLKYYPCKISWSKASGHQCVCVGYTNGFVALFNLQSKSVMLKYTDSDGIPCILPTKCFQAHSHAVTALAVYHLNGGSRWLMTGSVDRNVSLWDLENHSYPICNYKKNFITDGFWFTNWLCYITTCDEGSTSIYVTTLLRQVRDYLSDPNISLTCSLATISATTGSDWLNGIIHANAVGEIIALFPHQILHCAEHLKVLKGKRMLFGYTCLLEKGKTPQERDEDEVIRKMTLKNLTSKKVSKGAKLSKLRPDFDCDTLFVNEPVLYEEAEQKYALLFCDNHMKSYDDFPKTTAKQLNALSNQYTTMQPNQYPLSTINKIVFNPNRHASLYYATGYQAGFVRLSWMEFLRDDPQVL